MHVFGRPPRRGNPVVGYVPQLRTVLPDLRIRGFDVIASSMKGERWGLPALSPAPPQYRGDAYDSGCAGSRAAPALRDVRGRKATAAARPGTDRCAAAAASRRAADRSRCASPGGCHRLHSAVQPRADIAVLFSAHELNQLLGVLDRVLYLGRGRAALGTVEEVVTAPVLSRLYGTEIDVVHAHGHIFVMSKGRNVERWCICTRRVTRTITSSTTMAMFHIDFMVNAFVAAGIVAVVSGIVGFFLVMRGQTFAGHALSHIGFAGATGAGLIGLAPIWGLLGFTLGAGIGMGMLGERIAGRDVAIGVVLALALGFGLLFLHYYTSFATQATAILFGNVLAVDRSTIGILAALAVVTLIALAAIMRPLVFATLQPELAEAKSVPMRFVSTAFLAVVALAVSECAQIVGVLLVFALMVRPPAAMQAVTTGLWTGLPCLPRSRLAKPGSASRWRITRIGR